MTTKRSVVSKPDFKAQAQNLAGPCRWASVPFQHKGCPGDSNRCSACISAKQIESSLLAAFAAGEAKEHAASLVFKLERVAAERREGRLRLAFVELLASLRKHPETPEAGERKCPAGVGLVGHPFKKCSECKLVASEWSALDKAMELAHEELDAHSRALAKKVKAQ